MDDSIALRGVPLVFIVAAVLATFSGLYTVLQPAKAKTRGIEDSAGYRVAPVETINERPRPLQIALIFTLHFGIMLAGCAFGSLALGLFLLDWLIVYGLLFAFGCVLAVGAWKLNRPR